MTQEQKDLLLKDLCARLPYGVKAVLTRTNCHDSVNKVSEKDIYSFRTGRPLEEDHGQYDYYRVVVTDIKPYLLPISNMTKEQKKYIRDKHPFGATHEVFDWLDKNNYDYRGLIEKGLANDATNLNIY